MKISGVLLASGASKRLGKTKQLLRWDGDFLINHVIAIILSSEVDELLVVLGANAKHILPKIKNQKKVFKNDLWNKGKSSSIKCGIENLQDNTDAVIFFSVDQPFISKELIDKLIQLHVQHPASIISTRISKIPTIPMLFPKSYFKDLRCLEKDHGGKEIALQSNQTKYLDWGDKKVLKDIDTEEDYETLKKLL